MDMKKKVKIIGSILIGVLIAVLLFGKLFEKNSPQQNSGTLEVEISGSGEWMLTDDYDSENSSFEDFLKQKDAGAVLKETYKNVKDTFGTAYYDVSRQDIEYLGKFPGNEAYVSGGKDALNQKINEQILSPLESLQVSYDFTSQKKMDELIETGETFEKEDYQKGADQVIPVLAGASYQKIFKVGDTFQGKYLGEKDLKFQIKEFFKENVSVSLDNEEILLDRILVFPSLCLKETDSQEFQKILLSVKCQGYLHYDGKSDLEKKLEQLEKIKKETGFRYIIPKIR